MDEFIEDPAKAARYYREEFLRSMAARHKEFASYWKLVADIATQALRKSCDNSILSTTRIPFLHKVTALALSTKGAIESLEKSSAENKSSWSFKKNLPPEILTHYRYWIFFFIMGCAKTPIFFIISSMIWYCIWF